MIDLENFDEFVSQLEGAILTKEFEWRSVYQNFVNVTLFEVLNTSPQFSGNFTVNWRLNEGHPDTSYEEMRLNPVKDDPSFMGDPEAVNFAYDREKIGAAELTALEDVFYISNTTPYGAQIAQNRLEFGDKKTVSYLRPGNYVNPIPIPLGHVMLMSEILFARVDRS